MHFPSPLVPATLLRRYKRFLADVVLPDGVEAVAHCANPGSMLGLAAPGSRCWLSPARAGRKLAWSLELVEADGTLVGIDTTKPNRLAEEAIAAGLIPSLAGWAALRREVPYGVNSRIDLLLEGADGRRTFVEVKNCHLMRTPGLAEFPDCVTTRGAKHLEELSAMVRAGHRAVMLFVVQRDDCHSFSPAADLDPGYADAFRRALDAGVEAEAWACRVTPEEVVLTRPIPVLPPLRVQPAATGSAGVTASSAKRGRARSSS